MSWQSPRKFPRWRGVLLAGGDRGRGREMGSEREREREGLFKKLLKRERAASCTGSAMSSVWYLATKGTCTCARQRFWKASGPFLFIVYTFSSILHGTDGASHPGIGLFHIVGSPPLCAGIETNFCCRSLLYMTCKEVFGKSQAGFRQSDKLKVACPLTTSTILGWFLGCFVGFVGFTPHT